MPMPKGKKILGGYVTLSGRNPMKFRKIADIMTRAGTRMNHATARGVLMKGMEKIAARVIDQVGGTVNSSTVRRLIRNESFQSYVGDVLDEDALLCKDDDGDI